jgi:hypothetical protein
MIFCNLLHGQTVTYPFHFIRAKKKKKKAHANPGRHFHVTRPHHWHRGILIEHERNKQAERKKESSTLLYNFLLSKPPKEEERKKKEKKSPMFWSRFRPANLLLIVMIARRTDMDEKCREKKKESRSATSFELENPDGTAQRTRDDVDVDSARRRLRARAPSRLAEREERISSFGCGCARCRKNG